jgi:hypothetical protein
MPTMQLRDAAATAQEIRDEDGLLAEFERAGQTMADGERDPEPAR